ncbi:MAG TPA: hypothetical protein VMV72_06690 [Verrucomicrobiae bacterium]|nr:hypothetical protein [Verrucomicrobiae bacterium]
MTREQAKTILLAYRPGTGTTADPRTAEALALVKNDPELARWFEQQQRADRAIRASLRETPVPSDLKQRILAAAESAKAERDLAPSRPVPEEEPEPTVVHPEFDWRSVILAAAAVVVAVLAIVGVRSHRRAKMYGVNAYRTAMVGYVSGPYLMVAQARSFDELRQVLAQKGWPTDFAVPGPLRNVTVVGGGALEWNGHKVDLACLRESGNGLWLLVVDNAALPDAPRNTTPLIHPPDPMPSAVWTQDGKTYLFVAQGDEAFLKKYLP